MPVSLVSCLNPWNRPQCGGQLVVLWSLHRCGHLLAVLWSLHSDPTSDDQGQAQDGGHAPPAPGGRDQVG